MNASDEKSGSVASQAPDDGLAKEFREGIIPGDFSDSEDIEDEDEFADDDDDFLIDLMNEAGSEPDQQGLSAPRAGPLNPFVCPVC